MKIQVNTLSGIALDYAVAVALGYSDFECDELGNLLFHERWENLDFLNLREFRPSNKWKYGGPIIDSLKGFELKLWLEARREDCCEAHIHNYEGDWIAFGPTPLIAAMRNYVASQLGEEVEIPETVLGEMK